MCKWREGRACRFTQSWPPPCAARIDRKRSGCTATSWMTLLFRYFAEKNTTERKRALETRKRISAAVCRCIAPLHWIELRLRSSGTGHSGQRTAAAGLPFYLVLRSCWCWTLRRRLWSKRRWRKARWREQARPGRGWPAGSCSERQVGLVGGSCERIKAIRTALNQWR